MIPSRNGVTRAASGALRGMPAWVTFFLVLAAVINLVGVGLGGLPGWMARWLDWLSGFAAVFLAVFIEAVPFLLLGTLASGIIEVFVDRADVARWVPRKALPGALAGSLVGFFFPVGEVGAVPLTRRLISKGVPVPVGLAVLLAAPVFNPIVIASTLAAFGPGLIFWGRLGISLAAAVLTSLIFSLHYDPASLLRPGAEPEQPPVSETGRSERLRRVVVVAVDEFFEMGRFLVLGALLAAALQMVVPQSALLKAGQGPVWSALMMMGLAALLSAGSAVDAFLALAFTGAFSGGSILAFLVFGPLVDIKNTLMYLRVLKRRAVAYLILLPLMLTLVLAVFLNYFGRGW